MDVSDEALLDRFHQTRDQAAFRSLVQRYYPRIYNAAFRILGNAEEAEEVVQDTCVRVHQNSERFQKGSPFAKWIFRIAHNACMDVLRHKRRRKSLAVLPFDPQAAATDEEIVEGQGPNAIISQLADERPNPAEALDNHEQNEMIAASLTKLSTEHRTVVVLHDIEGFSYQEIADIIGASLGTVRSRLHYGRLQLRKQLAPYYSSVSMSPSTR